MLSVVIPIYNHAHFLEKSIGRILSGLGPDDEVIPVNDGSTDHTAEVIEGFQDPRVRPVHLRQNSGVQGATRAGFAKSRGDFLVFAAADDRFLPALLRNGCRYLEKHPNAHLSVFDQIVYHEDSRLVRRESLFHQQGFMTPSRLMKYIKNLDHFHIPPQACIVRRDVIDASELMRRELDCYCDWYFFTTIALRHGFYYVPKPGVVFRISPNSLSSNVWSDRKRTRMAYGNILGALSAPANRRIRRYLAERPVLSFSRDSLREILSQALLRPEGWWILQCRLLVFCVFFFVRTRLWKLLQPTFIKLDEKGVVSLVWVWKLFGARVSSGLKAGKRVKVKRPWQLRVKRGVVIPSDTKIESHSAVTLDSGFAGAGSRVQLSRSGKGLYPACVKLTQRGVEKFIK